MLFNLFFAFFAFAVIFHYYVLSVYRIWNEEFLTAKAQKANKG
jgi:hypothetical protein